MKTLIVYIKDSVFKYPNLFEAFSYELNETSGILTIIKQTREGQYVESDHAVFKSWDYYLIEEDHEI